jgi:DNA-binding GntR family transcriptional regulator
MSRGTRKSGGAKGPGTEPAGRAGLSTEQRNDLREKFGGMSQVQQIVSFVRVGIASMRWKPGDLLTEGDLADQAGEVFGRTFSRQPVREALAILDNEELVERLPRYGSRIRTTTTDEAREILTLRCVAECLIAEELTAQPDAVRAGNEAQIRRLWNAASELVRKAEAAEAQRDEAGVQSVAILFVAGDEGFHAELAELAGFPLWAGVSKVFRHKLITHQYRVLPTVEKMRAILDEHERILAAIRRGDAVAAKEATFSHIIGVATRYFPASAAHLTKLRSFLHLSASGAKARRPAGQ